MLNQLPVGRGGKLQPAQHLVLGLLHSGIRHLVRRLARCARRKAIRAEGLELDQISAGLRGDIDKTPRHGQVAIVIDARLRNDESSFSHAGSVWWHRGR